MEGEHTPTIIQLILSTDLVLIQLKDSLFNSSFSQQILHWSALVAIYMLLYKYIEMVLLIYVFLSFTFIYR